MSNKPLPKCLAIVLCDTVLQDARSNNLSIINIFNAVFAQNVPAIHPKLTVYMSFVDGYGEVDVTIKIQQDQTLDVLFTGIQKLKFQNPLQVEDAIYEVLALQFKNYGPYSVQVLINNTLITERRFLVAMTPPMTPRNP